MDKKNQTFSILALICGIISIIMVCCCPYVSIPTGILAIVFAVISKREQDKMDGLAKAGLICGIVGLVFSVLVMITFILFNFVVGYDSSYPMYEEIIDEIEIL